LSEESHTFEFQIITTTSPQNFTLPIYSGGASYTQNFTVDWGDTTSSTITSFDDADRIHSYTNSGTYNIVLSGTCQWFAFNNSGDRGLVKQLIEFAGDMGFKVLNFYGCSNLTTLAVLADFVSLITASNMFRYCASITTIPAGMFDGCTAINSFNNAFYNCSALTAIPTDLFKFNTAVTSFSGVFYNCTNVLLTSIPTDLFRYNTAVTSFMTAFNSCSSLTAIPATLFTYNTLVSSFENTFDGCAGLTAIPSGLFDTNTAATNFASCFYGCTGLTSIPTDLFRYNIAVTSFSGTFWNCSNITATPSGLIGSTETLLLQTCFQMSL
jgi:hypothetical protein